MQEEKSAVYTVILGVCLFLCLLMLGNMLMGRADTGTSPAAPEEGDAMEFHITEDDIASVMTEALPFPVEDTAVKISRDGTIAVTAAVTRQALTESNLVPGKLRTARHLFSSPAGYASFYFSYQWAEVLDKDIFEAFERAGGQDRETAGKFRKTILEKGYAVPPMRQFMDFMGRKPRMDAMLRKRRLAS